MSGRTDSNGNLGGLTVEFDKDKAIATIMGRQTAPEAPVEFGLEPPLSPGEVSAAISQVTFAPGPADVPAFYDFHDLQIAFEPVWQEALNDKFLEDAEAAYDQFVERGGAPAVDKISGLLTATEFNFNMFADGLFEIGFASEQVPDDVASTILITPSEWTALPKGSKDHLKAIASQIVQLRKDLINAIDPDKLPDIDSSFIQSLFTSATTKDTIAIRSKLRLLSDDAQALVAHARRLVLEREANAPFKPTHTIIDQLKHRHSLAYPFRYFAASPKHRSVNFGIMVTYRQEWTPVAYQVGELVSTIPLAPREMRKYTRKTVIKTKRAQQEIESNFVARRREADEKHRAESEIVDRVSARTNFSLTASGTFNIGGDGPIGGSATTTSTFSRNAEKHSESVKKEFREAILKTAEEFKNERKIEIATEESFEDDITESTEIQNPNDEIPVTFLFYELQRRFKINEKIHRLQSVVFVAQEIPKPSAIDKAWLISHDWILNRALLDDSHRAALTYASTSLVSEDVALREMRQALYRQRQLVEELKEDVLDRRALTGLRYAALQRQIERTAQSADSGGGGGLFGGIVSGIGDALSNVPVVGGAIEGGLDLIFGGDEGASEAAQIREGASRDAFERERREERELASRLQDAISTVEAMNRDYTERLAAHLRQLAQCERLLDHIRQYIMYYMQAIWSYEPNDQRFLRLRDVPIPVFEKDKGLRNYEISRAPMKNYADIAATNARHFEVSVDLGIKPPPGNAEEIDTKPLSEVADLNRPLGFIGNYMIFPMLESNPITEFMMDPYVTLAEGE